MNTAPIAPEAALLLGQDATTVAPGLKPRLLMVGTIEAAP